MTFGALQLGHQIQLNIFFQAFLLLSCLSVVLADYAAEDLRRFQKAQNRPLRTLRPIRKQRPVNPNAPPVNPRRGLAPEEFRVRPVTFPSFHYNQGNRIGMRQTPGPVGYLAHILRLLSYLVRS